MTARILDGNKIAQEIRAELAEQVAILRARGVIPGFAAVLVGDDSASASYVRSKTRACAEVGVYSETFHLLKETSQQDLLDLVQRLNRDPQFHGILVQLPLPTHIDERCIINALEPSKDVDALHPLNAGKLLLGEPDFIPCTPHGVQQILLRSGYSLEGQHVVICGRSEIVGKPLAALLMQKKAGANATVTLCHTRTRDLAWHTRQADILVAAAGSARLITAEMVREGAVVIDVGQNRISDPSAPRGFRLVGDVDFDSVKEKAAAITPVPGGVGPMTVAMLLYNAVQAARRATESG